MASVRGLWALREDISESQGADGPAIKHDIALPIARIPAFIAQTDAALARHFPGLRMVVFGHLGDGNLHYNISEPPSFTVEAWLGEWKKVSTVVHDCVNDFGGSISAEHGLGKLKNVEVRKYKSAVELALMQSIKNTLDPANIMNPGKVV